MHSSGCKLEQERRAAWRHDARRGAPGSCGAEKDASIEQPAYAIDASAAASPPEAAHPSTGEASPAATLRRLLTDGLDALYRFILVRVGSDVHAAEDVLQQTALVALTHARAPASAEDQEGWLRGIAKNLVLRHWRTARRDAATAPNSKSRLALELLTRLQAPEPVETRLLHDEQREQLLRSVAELTHEEQALLYAFYRQGKTRGQIAQDLGVTDKSVESRLYRARCRLREVMSRAPETDELVS